MSSGTPAGGGQQQPRQPTSTENPLHSSVPTVVIVRDSQQGYSYPPNVLNSYSIPPGGAPTGPQAGQATQQPVQYVILPPGQQPPPQQNGAPVQYIYVQQTAPQGMQGQQPGSAPYQQSGGNTNPGLHQRQHSQNSNGAPTALRDWNTTQCDCVKDEETCWWGCWCCWLLAARNAKGFDIKSSLSEIGIFWGYVVSTLLFGVLFGAIGLLVMGIGGGLGLAFHKAEIRTEVRRRLGIHGNFWDDFMSYACFPCCTTCQEAREAKYVNMPVIDYCSGELLSAQQASHEEAASGSSSHTMNGSFMEHVKALSLTSRIILGLWVGVFGIIAIVLLALRRGLSVVLILLIFVQPLLILYFVYWRSRRQYASLDYVVKTFAVGFWVSTFQSIVLEMILQVVILIILSPFSGNMNDKDLTEEERRHAMAKHLGAVVVGSLLMAFVVAAGVEESMKHFVVRCCRFPSQMKNPHTILVYLMAAALGFATAENVEYVFSAAGDKGPRMQIFFAELTVYIVRILMPIHVICSVLQAANLSRVITGLNNMNLFQILFPAIMLHGTFDFVLFLLGALAFIFPNKETLYSVLSVVFAVLLTILGLIAAVFMFNRTLRDYEGSSLQHADEQEDVPEVSIRGIAAAMESSIALGTSSNNGRPATSTIMAPMLVPSEEDV